MDLVAGPDAYRDLPRLLARVDAGENAINVLLSQDETYADISPVRHGTNGVTAYVYHSLSSYVECSSMNSNNGLNSNCIVVL